MPFNEKTKEDAMVAIGSHGVDKAGPAHAAKTPGRNDPCSCGSGKKYKNCCGANK